MTPFTFLRARTLAKELHDHAAGFTPLSPAERAAALRSLAGQILVLCEHRSRSASTSRSSRR